MNEPKNRIFFTKELLLWNKKFNNRQMPWKFEKNPYKIWLSEIILQQTRVEQGTAYFNRFVQQYPTIQLLARAPEKEVFKLWEGLGYYTRCKNLVHTARHIVENLSGKFPSTYEAIIQLKGIGPYTAAAISSFAFALPHAVVDGNVMRVLSRYFAIAIAIDSTEGKKTFQQLANELLQKDASAAFNQAIMDFGATICKPVAPLCHDCFLADRCKAFKQKKQTLFPVKDKKLVKKDRWFTYIIASCKNSIYIRKRTTKDIWQNLNEFILVESDKKIIPMEFIASTAFKELTGTSAKINSISPFYTQQLTHQTIHGSFIHVLLPQPITIDGYTRISKKKCAGLAFPRLITKYITEEKQVISS